MEPLKAVSLFALIGWFSLSACFGAAPNVLLIYSDDHGWADLALQGVDPDVRTPNLDQLARDGVRFSRGYVSAPQCVPSRAGVITGTHQNRFGVDDNNKGPLPLEVLTLPERLKQAGYVTGMCGKWHLDLGSKKEGPRTLRVLPDHMPHRHGFDEYWRGELRQFYASHGLDGKLFEDAPKLVSDDRFRVTVQTEAALSFLDRRAAKPEVPWFLYLAWYAPHVPLESPEPWFSKTPDHLPKERRQALAMIAAMDDGIGRLRTKLKEMGVEKNTLIFFIGDNGAPLKRGAWNGSLNAPLIGEKGMLTDGGVRVPFVAAWPGKIPPGQVYEQPVINLDVAATAVALAGLPHDQALDGVNLMPHLLGENKTAPHEALFWRWRSQAAVLEHPWKLIHLGDKESYLFDVSQPGGETKNLLAQHPEIAARLDAKLKAWSQGLHRPGAAEPLHPQDVVFFADHVDAKLAPAAPVAAEEPGSVQGWLCRNGTLETTDTGLRVVPQGRGAKAARVFITRPGLSVAGPVEITLRARAKKGGAARVSWRTKAESDFLPANETPFQWPAGEVWREVKVLLPIQGRLIHLRITPGAEAADLEIQSIELKGKNEALTHWQFGRAP